MTDLDSLAEFLSGHPAVAKKANLHRSHGHSLEVSGKSRLGDDCAAIANPSGTGHLLFAAVGMLGSFVEDDPWFAGYSAVMVNLSDVAVMGGRPVAVTDILWTQTEQISAEIWEGMQAAALAYGVPIVGGQTRRAVSGKAMLGAAVLGHAGDRLINSFDVKPGDRVVIAIDMHGGYRGDNLFWNSSTTTPPERLTSDLEMLPSLAEKGLCRAGKDIGNGGIVGTLALLCDSSEVGAVLDLEDLPCPMDVEIEQWLVSFPSYGFLLAIAEDDLESTMSHFTATKITCREIGHFKASPGITLTANGDSADLHFGQPRAYAAGGVFHAGAVVV